MKIKIDKELFQWEKNRKVNIEASSDEPVITVMEFYNPQSKVADAVEVENGEAEIPNYLLKVPYPIMAVACTGEIGETQAVDRKEFRVIKRLRPENYIDDGSSAPESPSTPPSSGGTSGGTGAPGKDGEDGATFIPYVSDEGILSWTNDKGLENPASVNIMGPKGEQGEVGPEGPEGPEGKAGIDGTDGYTPIKGIDYFTEDDKTEIVNQLSEKTYSKEEVNDKISKVNHLKRTIVSSSLDIDVTAENADQYVYMVPKTDSLTEDNYDEYMVIEGKIEKVGNEISLANYYTKTEVNNLIPFLDVTLTQSGAAADAKATGDGINAANTAAANAQITANEAKAAAGAYNFLDNSDFTNPVNQRGQTSFTGNGYVIDRWFLWSDNESANFNNSDGYVGLNPYSSNDASLSQRFPKGFFTAESYTLAYCDSNDNIIIDNNPIRTSNVAFDYVQIRFTEWVGVKWVALYEGEYTTETLPKYQPKEDVVELMTCLVYFHLYATEAARPSNGLDCSPPMRIPSITQGTIEIDGTTYYYNSADL